MGALALTNMPSFEEKAEFMVGVMTAMVEKLCTEKGEEGGEVAKGIGEAFAFAIPEPNEEFIGKVTDEFNEAAEGAEEMTFEQAFPVIMKAMSEMGAPEPKSEEELNEKVTEAFKEIDEDGNGKISLDEFGKAAWLMVAMAAIATIAAAGEEMGIEWD